MTTKTKAKKFRIRRNSPAAEGRPRAIPTMDAPAPGSGAAAVSSGAPAGAQPAAKPAPAPPPAAAQDDMPFAPVATDSGFGDAPFPGSAAAAKMDDPQAVEKAIAGIRNEGLTGRQLRMARRIAQKNGLTAASDYDAVRLLRAKGIDPFQRANMLELVENGKPGTEMPKTAPNGKPGQAMAPAPVPVAKIDAKPQLPSTQVFDEDTRAKEIIKMQRDIVRRRRSRLFQLFSRLAAFVAIPTLIAGYYFFAIATPMYSTKSEIVIQQADSGGGGGGIGSLFQGTGLGSSQDSIAVQGYLNSIEAMLRLEQDLGFIRHFSQPEIDPLQRLELDATQTEAHKVYKKRVKISYDPTEGIIKMEVIAADPEVAKQFAERLIFYAEEQVDNLTQRLREDQMKGARDSFADAQANLRAANERVVRLQSSLGVLNAESEVGAIMGRIAQLETQLQEKELQLQQLLDNSRPNQARVDGARGDIRRLQGFIQVERAKLTETSSSSQSLATITAQMRLAELDVQNWQLMQSQAMSQMESARIEANRQTRYLSLAVSPVAPDEPAYPRSFENTLLTFLIMCGVYLMVSLTASILREQVSA